MCRSHKDINHVNQGQAAGGAHTLDVGGDLSEAAVAVLVPSPAPDLASLTQTEDVLRARPRLAHSRHSHAPGPSSVLVIVVTAPDPHIRVTCQRHVSPAAGYIVLVSDILECYRLHYS